MEESSHFWLPLGFDEWSPAAQAVTLFFLTFVSEDLTTVGGALLAGTRQISFVAAFLGCFLGIWIGDAGLYLLARGVGRRLLKRAWATRLFKPEKVAECERWFGDQGSWVLISSRFVPGARLPSYLAAGFLRFSFSRFLLLTALVGLVWTSLIFGLAAFFGARILEWLSQWKAGGWVFLAGIVILFVVLRLMGKVFDKKFRNRLGAAWGRWTRWEFWPAWLFYPPVALYCLWLGIRYRCLTLPTAANPGIFSGGIVGESKLATLRELMTKCPEATADAFLIEGASAEERFESLRRICRENNLALPFIIKPDVGQRGAGVKLIRSFEQAEELLGRTTAPLIAQRYASGPHEAGIFYYRFPDEPRGKIFAITEKVFPMLVGDGKHTVEELIWRDRRARLIARKYLDRLGARRTEILPAGESLKLVEAGNHAQGCIFLDGWRLWTPALESRIDEISRSLNQFYFGRYDVRFADEDRLRTGSGFQIIELNGAASEATSIYDARNSLRAAYATLFRQWDLAFAIGAANCSRGSKPTRLGEVWSRWREYCRTAASYPAAD